MNRPITLLLAALLLFPTGCVVIEERVIHEPFAGLREMSERQQQQNQRAQRPTRTPEHTGWTIYLTEFSGQDSERQARQFVRQMESQTGIEGLWTHTVGQRTLVYRGRYPDPRIDRALQELGEIRQLTLDDQTRFPHSRLIPIDSNPRFATSEFDLRNHMGKYSLQIGFYDEEAKDFEKAAEDAVKALREDGVEAFFHHGTRMSIVTVGLFTQADFAFRDQPGGGRILAYGPRIIELQKEFPHNLGNGRTVVVTTRSGRTNTLPSFIVHVTE